MDNFQEENIENNINDQVQQQNEQQEQEVKNPIQAINDIKAPVINFEVNKEKSIKDQAKALVDYAATQKAVTDEDLVKDITNLKKEELKTGASASLKEEQARSKSADKNLQEASYGVYSGIADLIGLKKSLPKITLDILMWLITPFIIIWYLAFGLATGIINITMDCINSIVKRFADFSENAKKVIKFVFIAAVCSAILFTIYYFLNKYQIINF